MDYAVIALILAFGLIATLGSVLVVALKAIALALVARWFGIIPRKP